MPYATMRDGTHIHYKDWGEGPAVVLSHGWPLNADSWDHQSMFLASQGCRVIALDRRGTGRSTQTWTGYDYDTFADDLANLIAALDLKGATLVGFSMGGGEVARFIGRHGTTRLAKTVLIGAIPPLMLKTPNNPDGTPMEVFDGMRSGLLADRAQFFRDAAMSFFGANRPGSKVSQGLMDWFWLMGMQASLRSSYECVQAFSETDFTEDLRKFDVPTLIIHGDDDQIVPIAAAGEASAKLVKGAEFKVYSGAPHGLCFTEKDKINADLIAFIRS